ncbi:hypothetical protein CEQ90_14830 [Lewinellaceae bacterium SD302]|nr:hypothetical protein CEQ90_14830 [Lewinellaceae bacterium SD302]
MKRPYPLIFCLLACCALYGQSDCTRLTQEIKPAKFCNNTVALEVEVFNATSKQFGLSDTIAYRCKDGIKYYTFKNTPLVDWTPNADNDFELKASSDKQYGNNLKATIALGEGQAQVYLLRQREGKPVLISYTTHNGLFSGFYQEKSCDGILMTTGSYQVIDTLFTIKEKGYDPNTYQEVMLEKTIEQLAVRNGVWTFFDATGKQINREAYPGEVSLSPEADFCGDFRGGAPFRGKNVARAFQQFNDLTYLLDIPFWLSYDDGTKVPTYYFNGRLSDPAQVKVVSKSMETITMNDGSTTIQLTANVGASGALGKGKKPARAYLKANITYADGSGTLIILDGTEIRHFELQDGRKVGAYRKQDCSGNLLSEGSYCQRDTFYRDTVVTMNMEIYEEQITITDHNSITKRVGVWKSYDANGVAIKEQDYGECESY